MRTLRLTNKIVGLDPEFLELTGGKLVRLPGDHSGCTGLVKEWRSIECVDYPAGGLDTLFLSGIIELGNDFARLPSIPRAYLQEQFPSSL